MNRLARGSLMLCFMVCTASFFVGCSPRQGPPTSVPANAAGAQREAMLLKLPNASYYAIMQDPAFKGFVKTLAEPVLQRNCVSCHGPELKGARGIPNLMDVEWLWGTGSGEDTDETVVIQIEQTLLFGIRNQDCPASTQKEHYGGCPDTRYSTMPAWGKVDLYTPTQIDDLTDYTLSLSGQKSDKAAAARGKKLWGNCVECHGKEGYGFEPYGGPNLRDDSWLFSGDRQTVHDVINNGAGGACPPWGHKLDAATIKALAVYIYGKSTENY